MQSVESPISASTLYFNPRLETRLAAIREYPMVVFEAPMGYGKAVMVREYWSVAIVGSTSFRVSHTE